MDASKILRVENINKSFGGLKAIVNLTFSVKKGRIFGIIGPEGYNK
jgi:ABC-type branched-subunit amino acid transport system ATPase component